MRNSYRCFDDRIVTRSVPAASEKFRTQGPALFSMNDRGRGVKCPYLGLALATRDAHNRRKAARVAAQISSEKESEMASGFR
jgi:hypothetical protein